MSTQSVVNQDSYSKGTFKSPGVPAGNSEGIKKAAQYRIKAKAGVNTPVGDQSKGRSAATNRARTAELPLQKINRDLPIHKLPQRTQDDSLRKEARNIR